MENLDKKLDLSFRFNSFINKITKKQLLNIWKVVCLMNFPFISSLFYLQSSQWIKDNIVQVFLSKSNLVKVFFSSINVVYNKLAK